MELSIANMTCGGCAKSITKTIQTIDPAAQVQADPATRTVTVQTAAPAAAILDALAHAGYPATTR